jgi:hypothetical protein
MGLVVADTTAKATFGGGEGPGDVVGGAGAVDPDGGDPLVAGGPRTVVAVPRSADSPPQAASVRAAATAATTVVPLTISGPSG